MLSIIQFAAFLLVISAATVATYALALSYPQAGATVIAIQVTGLGFWLVWRWYERRG